MKEIIEKGSLHFTKNENGGFTCQELAGLSVAFEKKWDTNLIEGVIRERIATVIESSCVRLDNPDAQYFKAEMTEEEELKARQEIFKKVCAEIAPQGSLFEQFLFWFGHWWYYHPRLMSEIRTTSTADIWINTSGQVTKYIVPILPEQIGDNLSNMQVENVAVGFGHFALLFAGDGSHTRRIVTNTELFELNDVKGYTYLDILQSGKPVARSATSKGGERAFFDGTSLMAHNSFRTCAPKTIVTDWGYKVNSAGVTIVNGSLYRLIDVDDAVAQTTGAVMGMCEFSKKDQRDSLKLSEESAGKIQLNEDGSILLNDKTWCPIGMFGPSKIQLLDSGFALYDWSEFNTILSPRYSLLLVVDDNEDWVREVEVAFGGGVYKHIFLCY